MERNLIFWGIIELWVVALGVSIVEKVVVYQVPTPALKEKIFKTTLSGRQISEKMLETAA